MTMTSLNLLPIEDLMDTKSDMYVQPYLFFDGNCREALSFYHGILGGDEPSFMTYGQMPPSEDSANMPDDAILHAAYVNGKLVILGSDCPPGTFFKPQGFALSLETPTTEEAERVFAALSNGGSITMPIAKTFWSERFGMLNDKFGIPWMVSVSH